MRKIFTSLASIVVCGLALSSGVFADANLTFEVVVPDETLIEISLLNSDGSALSGNTSIDLTPTTISGSFFNEKNMTVNVGTNNEWGYNLVMSVSNTSLISTEDGSKTIPTLTSKEGGYTCTVDTANICDFTANTWGYKLNTATNLSAATNYLPLQSSITLNNNTSKVLTPEATSVAFGSKVNADLAPGTYSTTINFIATANPDPTPIMQNITTSTLASLMPSDGDITTLKDSRDNNKYQITNINGTYWMTSNLKIMGTISASESNFTGADFNISAGGDLTAGITYTEPRAHFNTSDPNSSTYGAYYNYCAASAGTVCNSSTKQDAIVDICPKGWRLPTQTEAQAFAYASSSNKNPVLAGYYYGGSLGMAGSYGYWWSATASNTSSQYTLYYVGSSWGVSYNDEYSGYSVRCVYDIPPTMQNVTSTKLAELIPNTGDTITLPDERDNTTYTVGRLADGKVWMLDNLALDLTNSTTLNNTTASNTNASATTLNYLKGTSTGTTSDKYATAAVSNWTVSYSYSAPLVNASYKDTTQPLAMEQSGTGKIGVYYNYCAATAGSYCYGNRTSEGSPSGNASEDICPKGWRMPTGGSSGEYQALYTAYSSDKANFVNALKTPLSGTFNNGSAHYQGSDGYFWSSTYRSAANMHLLYVSSSYISPQDNGSRLSGSSVRCLFGA